MISPAPRLSPSRADFSVRYSVLRRRPDRSLAGSRSIVDRIDDEEEDGISAGPLQQSAANTRVTEASRLNLRGVVDVA